jgi:hypothetical protein
MTSEKKPKGSRDDLLDWFTVSYRSIYLIVAAVVGSLAVIGGVYYYYRYADRIAPPPSPSAELATPMVTTARFRSLDGSVKVKPVGQIEWLPADTHMVLRKSDLVRTGPGGSAEVAFFDGTVVHVRPDSLITIEETYEDPSTKRRRVAWHISSGEVNFQTQRRNVPDSATEISTPTIRTTAGEMTDGGIRVRESGDSDVRVYRGSSQVETKTGEKVALGSSEGLKVDASGRPGQKQTLPAVPVLLAPSHQAEIMYVDPTRATTLLVWRPVQGASGYHVMLDYSPYFNRPVVDRAGIRDASVELIGLETGKYYWRVSAADKEGAEGAFSDFARFTVTRKGIGAAGSGAPPPLVIEALDVRSNILQVKGRTEPGATVTVNGQRLDVQGDGSFNEYITLEKPGRQIVVIRSTGTLGGVAEEKRTVVVG